MSMTRQLWSISGLSVELGAAPRTLAKRLADLLPDEEKTDGAGKRLRRWSLERVFNHLQRGNGGNGALILDAERARLAKEQADAQEAKNAVIRGALVRAEDVSAAMAKVSSAIVRILESIPIRLKRANPTLTQSDLDIVRAEIVKARNEAADYRSGY